MNGEDVLLWVPLLATGAAWLLIARRLWDARRPGGPIERLLTVTTVSLFLAILLFILYFLTYNFAIEYVHAYTSRGTPWYYRVAGLWGGQKGTILLWAAFSSLWLLINEHKWARILAGANVQDPAGLRRVNDWTLVIGLSVLLAFETLLLVGGTFARTDPYLAALRPDGTGLQPVLRTPFMIIHPPLQFVAYAFSTLLFGAGIAAVVTRHRSWADIALPWTRWGFLVTTIGLGLGGLWAYYVLNFGGYWAWDPVETANLLAWFPFLLLVHSLIYFRKRNMFAAAAPLFAVLTLVAALFSTFATRTGLWVSVHAFTDPSRNFASDPLLRMLSILDTSRILEWLGAMLLAAIFVALAAYLKRLHDDAQARSPPAAVTAWSARVGIGAFAAASLLAFLDVQFVLSALFELAHRISFGNAPVGLGVLAFGAALIFASPGLTAKEERAQTTEKSFWDRYVTTPRLVFLGVVLLSLAFLVTFLLQVLSVNGYQRAIYDQRAPLVALPILLVLPAALTHGFWGKKRVIGISAAAAALGIVLATVRPDHWATLLVLPALAWALTGTSMKLFKVSDLGRVGLRDLRIAGGLLLFGGILTMVYWSNPPSRIPLGVTDLYPSAWFGPIGFLLGLVATLSSIGVLRMKTRRAHIIGCAALFLGLGFLIGPLLAIAAYVLAQRHRAAFPDAHGPFQLRACAKDLRREIRKTGVYLIHVALVLGLVGYTVSTYEFRPETEIVLNRGDTASVHGYQLSLVRSYGSDFRTDLGQYEEVTAVVEVRKRGTLLDEAPLTMWLELPNHYAERVHVERFTTEDVYLRPVEFVTPERTFLAHENNVVLTSGQVDQVTLTVKTLPGMHLVWAGLWMIGVGMLVNLAAGAARFEIAPHRPSPD